MKTLVTIVFICLSTGLFSQQLRDQRILSGEYFTNIDPGEGNGTPISIGADPLWETNAILSDLYLPKGTKIYIRFKSTNNKWSAPRCIKRQDFTNNSGASIQKGEYFLNIDPGIGKASPITFNNGIAEIDFPELGNGDKVYFRINDDQNRWSPTRSQNFNFKEIINSEYRIVKGKTISNVLPMGLSRLTPLSPCYIGSVNGIPSSSIDSVYVRFQSSDKIYSQWYKRSRDPLDGLEDNSLNNFNMSIFPNPCSGQTHIIYNLSESANVILQVVGLLGKVEILVNEFCLPGKYDVPYDVSRLSSGVYFCQLIIPEHRSISKIVVLR